jgi:hypothetical protein
LERKFVYYVQMIRIRNENEDKIGWYRVHKFAPLSKLIYTNSSFGKGAF